MILDIYDKIPEDRITLHLQQEDTISIRKTKKGGLFVGILLKRAKYNKTESLSIRISPNYTKDSFERKISNLLEKMKSLIDLIEIRNSLLKKIKPYKKLPFWDLLIERKLISKPMTETFCQMSKEVCQLWDNWLTKAMQISLAAFDPKALELMKDAINSPEVFGILLDYCEDHGYYTFCVNLWKDNYKTINHVLKELPNIKEIWVKNDIFDWSNKVEENL